MKMEQSISKLRHIKFRRLGITQKKEYSILNMAKFEIKNDLNFVCVCILSFGGEGCHNVEGRDGSPWCSFTFFLLGSNVETSFNSFKISV